MSDLVTTGGETVYEAQAKEFLKGVGEGKSLQRAAKDAGTTLESLRKRGGLDRVCREMIERAEMGVLLDRKIREKLVKARLVELMMQDEDVKTALGAAKAIQAELGVGTPLVAQQINVVRDARVVESLRSLGLEVGDEKEEDRRD